MIYFVLPQARTLAGAGDLRGTETPTVEDLKKL